MSSIVRGPAPGARRTGALQGKATLPATVPAPWSLPTLAINERRRAEGVVYEYDFLFEGGWRRYESELIEGDRDAYVEGIYNYLEQTWLERKDDMDAFRREVKSYGGELFEKLFPPELRRQLWKHRTSLKNIRILSSEPFIPWELVHLKTPEGSLPRQNPFTSPRWALSGGCSTRPAHRRASGLRDGKARYIAPQYPDEDYALDGPQEEVAFLQKTFKAEE
jgi:hypothetical protein